MNEKIIGPHFNLHKIKLFINSAKILNFIVENMFLKQNIYFWNIKTYKILNKYKNAKKKYYLLFNSRFL